MINFYVGMIRRGKLTIDDVHEHWREAVAAAIALEQ